MTRWESRKIIEEVLQNPLPAGYVAYLQSKLQPRTQTYSGCRRKGSELGGNRLLFKFVHFQMSDDRGGVLCA